MKFHVVTTTNKKGWEQTGRRMATSFVVRWPESAQPLAVYAEDFWPDVQDVAVRRLPAWLDDFKRRHKGNPRHNGKINTGYNYRWDAVKFSHKVAALTDFALSLNDGILVWLDADTFTHAPVTEDWLDRLFPEPAYIAWLDRLNCYPECGMVMFRCAHPYHGAFMRRFAETYASDSVFKMKETHDSYVLEQLVNEAVKACHIPAPASLSGSANRCSHVFVSSVVGERLDHMKGDRKRLGRTPKQQRMVRDNVAYWQ